MLFNQEKPHLLQWELQKMTNDLHIKMTKIQKWDLFFGLQEVYY